MRAQVLALLQHNIELNGVEGRCSAQHLDWRAWHIDGQPGGLGSFELLLGADLLYASATVQVWACSGAPHNHCAIFLFLLRYLSCTVPTLIA